MSDLETTVLILLFPLVLAVIVLLGINALDRARSRDEAGADRDRDPPPRAGEPVSTATSPGLMLSSTTESSAAGPAIDAQRPNRINGIAAAGRPLRRVYGRAR